MNTGKHSVYKFLSDVQLNQLVIPEIQRDYVWTPRHVEDLLDNINLSYTDESQENPFLGFIYAYTDRDFAHQYMLVDGQQRLTTIFILLLVCHYMNNKKLPDYLLKDGIPKLDYKVRFDTHDFLYSLVEHCDKNEYDDSFDFDDMVWYHNDYKDDKTIQNIISNFHAIKTWITERTDFDLNNFISYIEERVEFSYFNITSGREGEDIYIYMNSRGRSLEPNETTKARYLQNVDDKKSWGEKWENWQDFFWKYRQDRPDADTGFNDFLFKLQIINLSKSKASLELQKYLSGVRKDEIDIENLPETIFEIEKYFNAYKWLVESQAVQDFFENYEDDRFYYSLVPPTDKKQIFYFKLLPILALLGNVENLDEKSTIRFIRFFFNISRKEGFGKDISNHLPNAIRLIFEYLDSNPEEIDVCGLRYFNKNRTQILNKEEVLKLSHYEAANSETDRENIERLFWSAEDIKRIFLGEIQFLLDISGGNDIEQFNIATFQTYLENIKTIFIKNYQGRDYHIANCLVYYGETWTRVTPFYYFNYDTQDWFLAVRNPASAHHIKQMLDDFSSGSYSNVIELLEKNIKDYFVNHNLSVLQSIRGVNSFIDQLRILIAFDYYSSKKIFYRSRWIAEDRRFNWPNDFVFFDRHRTIYTRDRYIGDGFHQKAVEGLEVLRDEAKLNEIITQIAN